MFRSIASKLVVTKQSLCLSNSSTRAVHLARRASSSVTSATNTIPSIKDLFVNLTIVDPSGARRKAKGIIGKSLLECCVMQGIDLGPSSTGAPPEVARTETWTEPTFGEGPTSGFDHVILVGNGSKSGVRMTPAEEQMIDDYWDFDEIFDGSRLASAVIVTKEMDGMTVYVPDRIVDDIP